MSFQSPPAAVRRYVARWIADFDARLTRGVGSERVQLVNWWRSREHNARVGGAPRSQHLIGLAADLVAPFSRARIVQALRSQGLVAVDEGDHVHVQLSPAGIWDRAIDALARARVI